MYKFLRIPVFFVVTSVYFITLASLYPRFNLTSHTPGLLRQSYSATTQGSNFIFAAIPRPTLEIKAAVASEDARPLVIESYLKHYKSPLAGLGDYIVKTADHFGLDPYLIVAIAQQESNLGKLMPERCHNAWGWGIHSKGTLCFDTWQEGINTFTSGLATKYIAYGLRTPEEIMTKYNATSPGGAWAKGVNQFLAELHSGSW